MQASFREDSEARGMPLPHQLAPLLCSPKLARPIEAKALCCRREAGILPWMVFANASEDIVKLGFGLLHSVASCLWSWGGEWIRERRLLAAHTLRQPSRKSWSLLLRWPWDCCGRLLLSPIASSMTLWLPHSRSLRCGVHIQHIGACGLIIALHHSGDPSLLRLTKVLHSSARQKGLRPHLCNRWLCPVWCRLRPLRHLLDWWRCGRRLLLGRLHRLWHIRCHRGNHLMAMASFPLGVAVKQLKWQAVSGLARLWLSWV
mmetsp:Transcript_62229/g.148482  ORF Transcript_62229/g.148482 Transcript_62229/m.148482 type:complete len:259 (+) Transcript_62229:1942-2718(+)